MDWLITVPKTIDWDDYCKEMRLVEDDSHVMNYRVHYFPQEMQAGDRCFICHEGKVRGWMRIVGMENARTAWKCSTTGRPWPAGKYIQRSGPFHEVDGPKITGFRGIRKYVEANK